MSEPRRTPSVAECDYGECLLSRTCVEYNAVKDSDGFLSTLTESHCKEYLEPVRTRKKLAVRKFKVQAHKHRARYE